MEMSYTEDYLFILWAIKHLPYPRNEGIQIQTSVYGYPVALSALSQDERVAWNAYRSAAQAALGARFVPYRDC